MLIPRPVLLAVSLGVLTSLALLFDPSEPGEASSATFVVATQEDYLDAVPGNGVCQAILGLPCSLRGAIMEANANPGADTITLPAGTYTLAIAGTAEDGATKGDLDITESLTINGAGSASTFIDGDRLDRVLHIISGTVSISGVTIRDGQTAAGGGGILNESQSSLSIAATIVRGNVATSSPGGGISNHQGVVTFLNGALIENSTVGNSPGGGAYNDGGTMTIIGSTIVGNQGNTGGGIQNSAGSLTVTNSTFIENVAAAFGGAVYGGGGTTTVADSTVTGNLATYGGGVGVADSELGITDTTISDNTATLDGGGIRIFASSKQNTISTSTISGNTALRAGGGISSDQSHMTMTNSTVSGNMAKSNAGGILVVTGTWTIASSTVANNTADSDQDGFGEGGGIVSMGLVFVNMQNTILAGNVDSGSDADCKGKLISLGYNVIQAASVGCVISGDTSGNITGQAAALAPLGLNVPGATQTHALLAGSPAIDGGSTDCPPPATDQRGVARPQGNGCDIGAYESMFASTATPTPTATPSPTPLGQTPTPTPTPTPFGQTPTPTPSPTPPGQTPSPTPTGDPNERKQGDVDCDGDNDSVDALKTLQDVAALPYSQQPGCPGIGDSIPAGDAPPVFGDVDCDGDVDAVDALKMLQHVAAIPYGQNEPCTDIGVAL